MPRLFLPQSILGGCLIVLYCTLALAACRTSEPTAQEMETWTRILGTWEYRSQGIQRLDRGTIHIFVRDGRLVGRIQDAWSGDREATVRLYGSTMTLDMTYYRIKGSVRNGRFVATLDRSPWTVSRPTRQQRTTGTFVARRIRSGGTGLPSRHGCEPLLREHSYICPSLFQ